METPEDQTHIILILLRMETVDRIPTPIGETRDESDQALPWGSIHAVNPNLPNHEIVTDIVTIGRSASCSVTVMDKRVSSVHCKISRLDDPQQYMASIIDLSTNGTYLNGEKVCFLLFPSNCYCLII